MTKMFGISFNMGSSLAGMQKMVNAELTAAKQENVAAKASTGRESVQSSSSMSTGTSGSSTPLTLAEMYKQNLSLEHSYLSNSRAELEKSSNSHFNYNA